MAVVSMYENRNPLLDWRQTRRRHRVSLFHSLWNTNNPQVAFGLIEAHINFLLKTKAKAKDGELRINREPWVYGQAFNHPKSIVDCVCAHIHSGKYSVSTINYSNDLVKHYIQPYFHGVLAYDITLDDIADFKLAINQHADLSQSNKDKLYRLLQKGLDRAEVQLCVTQFSDEKVARPKDRDRIQPLAHEQIARLRTHFATTHYEHYIDFRLISGFDTNATNTLKWRNVDTDNELIYLNDNRDISIKLIPDLLPVFKLQSILSADSEFVFISENGCSIESHNFNNRYWKPACNAIGVTASILRLRDNAIIDLFNNGYSKELIAQYAGFSDPARLERFYRPFIR
jgi:hypothetical protein